ncbi:MAG: tRNA uridine-5-carboxymethylaminomethyl(34) synthesis GTPase MnmE, partial [Spirochaetaceae bacterium]|nr:tRNA uridine-5-carboxymethylaminomethyl(34) synthesis GTPase MnmE [Spirochaetaceae bacterium]
ILRLSGKNTLNLLAKGFSRPAALLEAPGHTIIYGWILSKGEKVDEVQVAVYKEGKSFTGEEMAEIFCHGGTSVVQRIFALMQQLGFRPAEKGEFSYRAFLNGKSDLTKSEAVAEIIHARTSEACENAVLRLQGRLFSQINSLKDDIISATGHIIAEVEYPEEEAMVNSFDAEKLRQCEEKLMFLSRSWERQKLFQEGIQVVLAGRTNAGKSSLFNALTGENRSIVSDIHGTTRDWVESQTSFDGIPVRLFDTAGLRISENEIENEGIRRTHALTDTAQIIFYLSDGTENPTDEDCAFLEDCQKNRKHIILVRTKKDLPNFIPNPGEKFAEYKTISLSATTGEGIDLLIQSCKECILENDLQEAYDDDWVGLGSERQKFACDEALSAIQSAIAATDTFGIDAALQDLDDALFALGKITGETTPDDILTEIFSNFCLGK